MVRRASHASAVSLGRVYRLVALAALFFASGLVFFFWHRAPARPTPGLPAHVALTPSGLSSAPATVIQAQSPLVLTHFPSPDTLRHFTYRAGKPNSLEVAIVCRAAYYTVLVYPAATDYRQNAGAALYNVAKPCPTPGEFTASVPLGQLNLAAGEYYLVRAHQGAKGSWYDAY